jgi:hypothetical protein
MSLPGFTADAVLERVASYLSRPAVSEAQAVMIQQFNPNTLTSRSASISRTPSLRGCIDIDHVPVCRGNPATPFGRCCDTTYEKVCNGRRVAICTLTDCTGFPDTNTSVLT